MKINRLTNFLLFSDNLAVFHHYFFLHILHESTTVFAISPDGFVSPSICAVATYTFTSCFLMAFSISQLFFLFFELSPVRIKLLSKKRSFIVLMKSTVKASQKNCQYSDLVPKFDVPHLYLKQCRHFIF